MTLIKIEKAKARRKDYEKKRNIIKRESKEIANGKRIRFSVRFPKRRKYLTSKKKSGIVPLAKAIEIQTLKPSHNRITSFLKRYNFLNRSVD